MIRAKQFLMSHLRSDLQFDQMSNCSRMQAKLLQKTDQLIVPSAFVLGKHIGGNEDFQALPVKEG